MAFKKLVSPGLIFSTLMASMGLAQADQGQPLMLDMSKQPTAMTSDQSLNKMGFICQQGGYDHIVIDMTTDQSKSLQGLLNKTLSNKEFSQQMQADVKNLSVIGQEADNSRYYQSVGKLVSHLKQHCNAPLHVLTGTEQLSDSIAVAQNAADDIVGQSVNELDDSMHQCESKRFSNCHKEKMREAQKAIHGIISDGFGAFVNTLNDQLTDKAGEYIQNLPGKAMVITGTMGRNAGFLNSKALAADLNVHLVENMNQIRVTPQTPTLQQSR